MITPKPGDRIRLLAMLDDPDPIPFSTTGTVAAVRHQGTWAQVDVDWDGGRALMLVVPPMNSRSFRTRRGRNRLKARISIRGAKSAGVGVGTSSGIPDTTTT
jgi:hypothetical protein